MEPDLLLHTLYNIISDITAAYQEETFLLSHFWCTEPGAYFVKMSYLLHNIRHLSCGFLVLTAKYIKAWY